MPTERSTSGVSPSKSRLERKASFMKDDLSAGNSILQHRTFLSRGVPPAPSSNQRRQRRLLAHQAHRRVAPQTVPALQDVEYYLGAINLYGSGGSQRRRFFR